MSSKSSSNKDGTTSKDPLTISGCNIGTSHYPYRARFGRDSGCSRRRTQSAYNNHKSNNAQIVLIPMVRP